MIDCVTRALLIRYRYEIHIQSIRNAGYSHKGNARIKRVSIVGAGLAAGRKQDARDAFRTQGCKLASSNEYPAFWSTSSAPAMMLA
jgi:hypothetical protein